MSLSQGVKLALRITHTYLDGEIDKNIATARAELIRSGLASSVVNSTTSNPLIDKAIVTYCLKEMSESKAAEGYEKSWLYQLDCLRKTSAYNTEVDD